MQRFIFIFADYNALIMMLKMLKILKIKQTNKQSKL
jgi:hypothetical protein